MFNKIAGEKIIKSEMTDFNTYYEFEKKNNNIPKAQKCINLK